MIVAFLFFHLSRFLDLAPSASKRDADKIVVAKRPTKQKRAPLKDISNIGEEEPDPSDGSVESCPTSLQFAKFEYTRKNINKARVEYICKYSRSSKKEFCKHARLFIPIVDGKVRYDQLYEIGAHTKGCCEQVGRDVEEYEYYNKPKQLQTSLEGGDVDGDVVDDAGVIKEESMVNVTQEMYMRTRELATDPNLRTKGPKDIWPIIKDEMDIKYPSSTGLLWHGMLRDQVTRLVSHTRNELGMGNSVSTIENTLEYSQMTDAPWSFLRFSATLPDPDNEPEMMRFMMFGNPEVTRLLKMPQVDIFMDATFDCCPHPFYQCLIVMVYDPTTSLYVPVLYCLMTRKNKWLYWQVFSQVVVNSDWGMNVRTFTTDFELALMGQAEHQFGKGKHIGCFFHLKQAWRRYLTKNLRMDPAAIKVAMEVGGLDLLCIIPRYEIVKYGIPYVRAKVESGQSAETITKWNKFWEYFNHQWLKVVPISSWNICEKDGEYVDFVNRTNNALERYNRRFNSLFPKKPSLIEFVQVVENESRAYAEDLRQVRTKRRGENLRDDPTIPTIDPAYYAFKANMAAA